VLVLDDVTVLFDGFSSHHGLDACVHRVGGRSDQGPGAVGQGVRLDGQAGVEGDGLGRQAVEGDGLGR